MMNEKQEVLKQILSNSIEEVSKLKIITLEGPYDCLLLKKIVSDEEVTVSKILVKTLKNDNPAYEEGKEIEIDLLSNGLIEFIIIE